MAENFDEYINIPKEKFEFANVDTKLHDKKFVDKPVGYFKDALRRFCRSKASIVAAFIILFIFLFAFLTPLFNFRYDSSFWDTYYKCKGPRNLTLYNLGFDGGADRSTNEKGLLGKLAIGVGAEDWAGEGNVTIADGKNSKYQPVIKMENTRVDRVDGKKYYDYVVDAYYEVGFINFSVTQDEYQNIRAFEEESGLHVLYPLIENNEYHPDEINAGSANYWYKANSKYDPVSPNEMGGVKKLTFSDDLILEDNYMRDGNGNVMYYTYTGGGDVDTAMYKIRVLYYNYYIYRNGFEPEYIFGTDSQGYDLALRLADGVRLSLLIAICVSVINFIIGATYGAIEGYYGGAVDFILERISDILNGIPFIVVATLFQIHLAKKLGPIPCLLFAYVLTGWIGPASRVRTQFYRFKNSEYVMAARTLGANDKRIIMKHIFPNSLGTLITASALTIPSVIFSESMLSFLGIVKLGGTETTSLGTLLSDASSRWTNFPHLMLFPAVVISLLMISFNLFGNGLRDAFNPSLRGVEE